MRWGIFLASICLVCGVAWGLSPRVHAETADELRAKIVASKTELDRLNKEIVAYQNQLSQVGSEKKTLQSAITQLELSRKKIQAQIQSTEQKIRIADGEITELSHTISSQERAIGVGKNAMAEMLRAIDRADNTGAVQIVLSGKSLGEVWRTLDEYNILHNRLLERIASLSQAKQTYEKAKTDTEAKKETLDSLKTELSGQHGSLSQTKKEKDALLVSTKNKEASYATLLAEKKKAKEDFEREINLYESKLSFVLNPASIPAAGSGVLRWPLDSAFMSGCSSRTSVFGNTFCITQYFGDTAFAKSGAYNGNGHNGIDFGSPTGTGVVSALGGEVVATNEEVADACQYGKWVLVRHGNGLTTLYAHLSSISVAKGAVVKTGQLLGYSGATGYATGPHLHFTVYASDAVQFKAYTCRSGKTLNVPVAAFSAYLDPMKYL